MRLRKLEDHLCEKLRDPEYAAAYLDAAKENGWDEFLCAMRDVATAVFYSQNDEIRPHADPVLSTCDHSPTKKFRVRKTYREIRAAVEFIDNIRYLDILWPWLHDVLMHPEFVNISFTIGDTRVEITEVTERTQLCSPHRVR
jgi:hypothetical protein